MITTNTANAPPDKSAMARGPTISQHSVIQSTTTDYLAGLALTGPPDPIQVEGELLHLTQLAFDAYNKTLTKAESDRKWRIPIRLTMWQIATILLTLYPISIVMLAGDNEDRDFGVLAIYDPEDGLYHANEDIFHRLIESYDVSATMREHDNILKMLHHNAPLVVNTHDRDLIAVNNGVFDYRTKTLLPFDPKYVFTKKSKVDYNPNARNPIIRNQDDGTDWDVESWMAGLSDDPEVVDLLWCILGAIIRPHVRWDKSAWLYSTTGNNGKGTLCELMRNLCGPGSYASIPLEDFGKDFLLEPLLRATAIIVDENNVGGYIDKAANLKAVITNDVVPINRKFKTPIAYQFFGFMVQCLNEMPRVKDKSDSFYRRQLFIPFDKCFTGKERKYIKDDYLKRKDVLEYVLYKVLNTDFYVLPEPASCRAALNEYKEFNDPIRQFAYEMIPQISWRLAPNQFLYDLYVSWNRRNNSSGQVVSKKQFLASVHQMAARGEISGWTTRLDKNEKCRKIWTGTLMNAAEPLIIQYNLTDWRNPAYRGTDPDMICRPQIQGYYYGLIRDPLPPSPPSPAAPDPVSTADMVMAEDKGY